MNWKKIQSLGAALVTIILIQARIPAQPAPDGNGAGKVVALDVFYNRQVDKTGKPYHYIWADTKNSGFSQFGDVFKSDGAQITTIAQAPTADDLKKTSIFMICNPSIPENAADGKPNYIAEPAISAIDTPSIPLAANSSTAAPSTLALTPVMRGIGNRPCI